MHAINDIDSSLNVLRHTFSQGKTKSYSWRVSQLNALLLMCEKHEADICEALNQDLNKSYTEAYLTEVGYLKAEIKHALKHLKKWMKPRKVSTPMLAMPGKSFHQPEPLGVVFVMGAWNFPFHLTLAPLVAAIAAGNCAVIKPSELTEKTSALIADLVPRFLDQEAFVVFEGGKDISTELLARQFDHIFYTGGEHVGKIVMQAASKYLTPVTLELGGKSPCIIDKDCDLLVAARRIAWGKFTNAGQICIAPDYLLVHDSVKTEFLDKLKQAMAEHLGQDAKNSNDYGRIVNDNHFARLTSYLEGLKCDIVGGQSDAEQRYIQPTLLINPPQDAKVMQEEIFGPILPVITYGDHKQAAEFINSRPKPLALYVFTSDDTVSDFYLNNTSSGNMCINDTLIFMSNADLAFGGVGNSGMGRYHGQSGFDLLSNMKAVMKRPFAMDVSIRYAPFNKFKLALLRRMQ